MAPAQFASRLSAGENAITREAEADTGGEEGERSGWDGIGKRKERGNYYGCEVIAIMVKSFAW